MGRNCLFTTPIGTERVPYTTTSSMCWFSCNHPGFAVEQAPDGPLAMGLRPATLS